jgi:hypothetical protein
VTGRLAPAAPPESPAAPETDWDALVDALRGYGVRHLSGGTQDARPGARARGGQSPPEAAPLVARLALSPEPRLRRALVPLFLVHPELAGDVREVAGELPGTARDALVRAYVAAVYLQRLWWTRLRRYLGDQPLLPPYWIDELGLPPPEDRFGRVGLAALAEREGRRQAHRADPYAKAAQSLFGQLLAERAVAHRLQPTPAPA